LNQEEFENIKKLHEENPELVLVLDRRLSLFDDKFYFEKID